MFQNIDLTQIIVAVIGVLGAVITTKLIPYLKAKTGVENWSLISFWAKIFVQSAEIIIDGTGKGDLKRNDVLDNLRKKCDELNIKYSEADIRAALENAWSEMTGGGGIV